jgi:hypothetical protein
MLPCLKMAEGTLDIYCSKWSDWLDWLEQTLPVEV